MRIGRIQYVNAYPVYGAIDRGLVSLRGTLVSGVPTELNRQVAAGQLDVSVVSAVEYARDAQRYLLLPDLGITSDGPVRSVMLYSRVPASELSGRRVLVSRSSMTSVELLRLLFEQVWRATPDFVPADAEVADVSRFGEDTHAARLVIGDAALLLEAARRGDAVGDAAPHYPYAYDLGDEWKRWTGLPFVFAVWVARRDVPVADALGVHASLIAARDWGERHLAELSADAERATGVDATTCHAYLRGLEYHLGWKHLAGLAEFFRRLSAAGRVPDGGFAFLPA
ncbi:MAG: menaquinone biosynthesis protein [Gemmatimonadaceae bacterium]|jgi:chorismate dehydratase|nr:menaquinone biosynthesis protein [Gemmatimonadaceae bacterium]